MVLGVSTPIKRDAQNQKAAAAHPRAHGSNPGLPAARGVAQQTTSNVRSKTCCSSKVPPEKANPHGWATGHFTSAALVLQAAWATGAGADDCANRFGRRPRTAPTSASVPGTAGARSPPSKPQATFRRRISCTNKHRQSERRAHVGVLSRRELLPTPMSGGSGAGRSGRNGLVTPAAEPTDSGRLSWQLRPKADP
jgi:hypothetical protein